MKLTFAFALASISLLIGSGARNALAQSVQVTITSDPQGEEFTVAGNGCSQRPGPHKSPETLSWPAKAQCTILWTSPAQAGNARLMLHHWSDGPNANPRSFAAPAENSIFTAVFVSASLLAVYAKCVDGQNHFVLCGSSPGIVALYGLLPGASVTSVFDPQPNDWTSTGFFPVGSQANIIATENRGFAFVAWTTGPQNEPVSRMRQYLAPISGTPSAVTAVFRKNGQ